MSDESQPKEEKSEAQRARDVVQFSDAFQQASLNHVTALRDPKLGFLRTAFHLAKETKNINRSRENLKSALPGWDGSTYQLTQKLNEMNIDTSRLEKATKATDEIYADPEIRGFDQNGGLLEIPKVVSNMLKVSKKLGRP